MIAQARGHDPSGQILDAPQPYVFEPHQTEQMGGTTDPFLGITPVLERKRAAIVYVQGEQHPREHDTRVAQQRVDHCVRDFGGQSGGRDCRYAEGFQSVFARTVDEPWEEDKARRRPRGAVLRWRAADPRAGLDSGSLDRIRLRQGPGPALKTIETFHTHGTPPAP